MDRQQDPEEFRLFIIGFVHAASQDVTWITSLRLHASHTWEIAWEAGRYNNASAYAWTWCWLFQLCLCVAIRAYLRNVFQKGMRSTVLYMRRWKQFCEVWKKKLWITESCNPNVPYLCWCAKRKIRTCVCLQCIQNAWKHFRSKFPRTKQGKN